MNDRIEEQFAAWANSKPSLISVGKACELSQVVPEVLIGLAAELKVEPTFILDGVMFFEAADVDRIMGLAAASREHQKQSKRSKFARS